MIKIEKTEVFGWEAAIRELYNEKGVRFIYPNSYESYISIHGKFLSCGTFSTEEQAREVVIITKVKLFKENIVSHGDNPKDIVESIEKGYFVSPKGNIYNRHGNLIKGAIDHCGYKHVILNRKNKRVHRLVAETFIPNPDNKPCVNHIDGNKLNNAVDNLEWCTHSENTKHAYDNGLEEKQCGEKRHAHKLDWDKVKYIRQVYIKRSKTFSAAALAKKFGVDRSTITAVIFNKTWRETNDFN